MRVASLPALVAVLVAAGGGVAAAEGEPDRAFYPRVSLGLGIGDRMGDVAGLSPGGLDLHGELEVQLTPVVFALATYDVAWVTDRDPMLRAPVSAVTDVATVGLRHVVLSFGEAPTSLGGDLFVDAAVGREVTRWEHDARLTRAVVSLGFGGTVTLPRAARALFHRVRYGFRFDVARAPDPGKVPLACDGPCDELTRTRPYDKSMTLEIMWHVGR